jgi:hypothetical protein
LPHVFFLLLLLLLLHHLLLHEGLRRRPNTEYKERVVASACSLYANKISLPLEKSVSRTHVETGILRL